jgi:hypothetical protein
VNGEVVCACARFLVNGEAVYVDFFGVNEAGCVDFFGGDEMTNEVIALQINS